MGPRARAVVAGALLVGRAAVAGAAPPVASDVVAATEALEPLYRALAACVGVARPKRPPRLEIRPGRRIRCPGVTPEGTCSGLHRRRPRRVLVTYATTHAIPHELLHDVLCQLSRAVNPLGCDPDHRSPYWERCLR